MSIEFAICCCGESLNRADWDSLPINRIAVNEAGKYVPGFQYFAAVDKINIYDFGYTDGVIRITTTLSRMFHGEDYNYGNPAEFIEYDAAMGSLDIAVKYALENGAKRIYFVGADGKGTHIPEFTNMKPDYPEWCKRVMKRCVELCTNYNCPFEYV